MNTVALTPLLKRKPSADFLGISLRKFDELVASGAIPVVRIGKSVRVSIAELEQFVERGGTKS